MALNFWKGRKPWARAFDLLAVGLLIVVVARLIPQWKHSYQIEGRRVPNSVVQSLDGSFFDFPLRNKVSSVLIFWHTECGPCVLELRRFRDAVANNELDGERIFAVNVGEPLRVVRSFSAREKLNFPVVFAQGQQLLSFIGVMATPTVVHLSAAGVVTWTTTGVSPLGIVRAQSHLSGL